MKPLYSAQFRGFYFREIHGEGVPDDAISITESEYLALLNKQVESFSIQPGTDGYPVSVVTDSISTDTEVK